MEDLRIIRSKDNIQELLDYIDKNDFIAVDTETTGVTQEAKIIGFSVSADVDLAYYVVLRYWDVETQKLLDLDTVEVAHEILSKLVGKTLIMHHGVFDCSMIYNNYRIKLIDYVHTDTMILAHLLDEIRHNGLKELGVAFFGEDAKAEQAIMKESVIKNGGKLTKDCYELYKADSDLIAKYGAKDTILTIKLFYALSEQLLEEKLDTFFFEESMPLLRSATYELNTTGLKVDMERLNRTKAELEASCLEDLAFIDKEVYPLVKDKYPATEGKKKFNINSTKQLAWLLFVKLGNNFDTLTDAGREICHYFGIKLPYSLKAKREFIDLVNKNEDTIYQPEVINLKTGKKTRAKKVGSVSNYLSASKTILQMYSKKYMWLDRYLQYKKNSKILSTYIEGIREKAQYGIIRPSFLQHGTTSGRYSSRHPNFQNLPRKDTRVKSCIVSRPKKVFVGADYSQLEPRVFAYFSQDERLMNCFSSGDDFYSVIGREVFKRYECGLKKDESNPNCFAMKYPAERDIAKVVALSATYGTTAPKLAPAMSKEINEAQEIIDEYFENFPKVKQLQLESHQIAKKTGRVTNLFGRPRRIPEAKEIDVIYGTTPHEKLPYQIRNTLNLAINHRIQSTGASIMNRAAIAFCLSRDDRAKASKAWGDTFIVSQIHDELVVECPEEIGQEVAQVLKFVMENTTKLPGVLLETNPKIGKSLTELK